MTHKRAVDITVKETTTYQEPRALSVSDLRGEVSDLSFSAGDLRGRRGSPRISRPGTPYRADSYYMNCTHTQTTKYVSDLITPA